jgi:hypothetical protein
MDPQATDTLRLCIFQFMDNMDFASLVGNTNTRLAMIPDFAARTARTTIRRGVGNGNVVNFPHGALAGRHTYGGVIAGRLAAEGTGSSCPQL